MIGEWNGTVTSKYSAIGAKTDPPRSFISRIFLERCDSFCALFCTASMSSGYPDSTM
ncbi:Uncharacterised protein [Chlamydia trachomatis]|nr:Uncharacterised protein [Chlamydia trachomatis]